MFIIYNVFINFFIIVLSPLYILTTLSYVDWLTETLIVHVCQQRITHTLDNQPPSGE